METTKKSLLIFLALIIVGGSAYGAFYLLKKYINKTPQEEVLGTATTTSVVVGLTRDTSNKIPSVFPKGLVIEKDIATVIESFSVPSKVNKTTQYTFKYVSNKSLSANYKYFSETLTSKNSGWSLVDDIFEPSFSSITVQNKAGNMLSIVINDDSLNLSIVDITLVK